MVRVSVRRWPTTSRSAASEAFVRRCPPCKQRPVAHVPIASADCAVVRFSAQVHVLSYAVLNSDDIIELAYQTAGGQEFLPTLLGQLRAAFESAASAIHVAAAYPVTGGGPLATVGFDPDARRACSGRWPTYLHELAPLARVATGAAGVASDRDAFLPSERSRKAYFKEFVAPQGGGDTLVAYLCLRNRPVAALSLCLSSRPWSAEARRELAALLPALSVAVASARCAEPQWGGTTRLTPREQQVLAGIDAGLSNAEIAACCGTSVNTVRNQVASLLCKLEASSRAELAARSLSSFVERHV